MMSEIRNISDPSIVVFKHPNEDFNTKSHLALNPSEVALFVNTKADGTTETLLMTQGGTLDTHNLPFFRSITQVFTGGQSMFHCAIYFVRTNFNVTNNWGTEAPIGPLEDCRHYTFKLVANGTYDFQIVNPSGLIENILGFGVSSVTQQEVALKLNPKISNFVGTTLSGMFVTPELSLPLPRIQTLIRTEGRASFQRVMNEEYSKKWGVEFSDFTINVEDVYEGLAEHYTKNNQMIQQSEAIDYQGKDFNTVQLYDVLKLAAANPGNIASSMMGMGVGAGMGASLGSTIGSTINTTIIDSSIGGSKPTGQPAAPSRPERVWGGMSENEKKRMERQSRMKELKDYLDAELIDQATYNRKVSEIINEL